MRTQKRRKLKSRGEERATPPCYVPNLVAASWSNFGSEIPFEPKLPLKTEFWCNAACTKSRTSAPKIDLIPNSVRREALPDEIIPLRKG